MNNPLFYKLISQSLGIAEPQIAKTIELLDGGATIPFISRYRKEATGSLDEVQIGNIKEAYDRLCELAKRKESILSTIGEQGKLTDELRQRIDSCWNATELEDIYLPYKPRRRTRAEIAREHGLEPLAKIIMSQRNDHIESNAGRFVNAEVPDTESAIKGACDIIAEWVSENERARHTVRRGFEQSGVIAAKVVKGKEAEGDKYRDYFAWSEPLRRCASHKILAVRRGENEGILRVSITPDDEQTLPRLQRLFVKGDGEASRLVTQAVADSYKRLLRPSIESEFAASSKERADDEAIAIFAGNVRQLLLAPPLGQKRVLAIDPGYRTGCKVVCLDAQGNLLHNETIYPHPPRQDYAGAARKLTQLVESYKIEAIAIGNGTAGRETEQFVTNLRYDRKIQVFVVSESGASIYSASKVAREEFPDQDVTVRGAVSIGRRLIDPLAELVKIDPKSIGVGQYQHDVDQSKLKKSLDRVVEYCVNSVGVNVNTASKHLLTYISGLGPQLAQNIVEYRQTHGDFTRRSDLLDVPRMGAKAYEQSAGFLRIPHASNPLDNSAVHPERYPIVERMAADLGCTIGELIENKALKKQLDFTKYIAGDVGMPTLTDIMEELDKPGRDPRRYIEMMEFDSRIKSLDDLQEGMVLNGIVTNITQFGCFVDIGIKENGLVHISQMADRYIANPAEVVAMHQPVRVRVIGIDRERRRIQLSLKEVS